MTQIPFNPLNIPNTRECSDWLTFSFLCISIICSLHMCINAAWSKSKFMEYDLLALSALTNTITFLRSTVNKMCMYSVFTSMLTLLKSDVSDTRYDMIIWFWLLTLVNWRVIFRLAAGHSDARHPRIFDDEQIQGWRRRECPRAETGPVPAHDVHLLWHPLPGGPVQLQEKPCSQVGVNIIELNSLYNVIQ